MNHEVPGFADSRHETGSARLESRRTRRPNRRKCLQPARGATGVTRRKLLQSRGMAGFTDISAQSMLTRKQLIGKEI
jgi:hypothetical protein